MVDMFNKCLIDPDTDTGDIQMTNTIKDTDTDTISIYGCK